MFAAGRHPAVREDEVAAHNVRAMKQELAAILHVSVLQQVSIRIPPSFAGDPSAREDSF
ncbi:MAG TPA: hypothetical protein V6D47_09550 [Oscillatoriaceae cyanobacterium]